MSKLPTAKEFLIKKLQMSNIQAETLYKGYINAMEEYANLRTQALKEENDRLEEENKKLRFQILYGRR